MKPTPVALLPIVLLLVGLAGACARGVFGRLGESCEESTDCGDGLGCVSRVCSITATPATGPAPPDAAVAERPDAEHATAPSHDAGLAAEVVWAPDQADGSDGEPAPIAADDAAAPIDVVDALGTEGPQDAPSNEPPDSSAVDGDRDRVADVSGEPLPDAPLERSEPVPPDPRDPAQVNALGLTADGHLWAARGIYSSRPRWENFVDVTAQATVFPLGQAEEMDAETLGPELVVVARAGTKLATVTARDSLWRPWAPLAAFPATRSVGLTRLNGRLIACLLTGPSTIALSSRGPGEPWSAPLDVAAGLLPEAGPAPRLTHFDCAGSGGRLHILAVDEVGQFWMASREDVPGTPWTRLQAIRTWPALAVRFFDVVGTPGEVHVIVATTRAQYHGMLFEDGTLSVLDNMTPQTFPPDGDIIGSSATAVYGDVHMLRLVPPGALWHSARTILPLYLFPFGPLPSEAPLIVTACAGMVQ